MTSVSTFPPEREPRRLRPAGRARALHRRLEDRVVDPRLDLPHLGVLDLDRLGGRLELGLLLVERGSGGLDRGGLLVVFLASDDLAVKEVPDAVELLVGQIELALAPDDARLHHRRLLFRLRDARLGLGEFGLERGDVHPGHDLPRLDQVAFVGEDFLDPSRLLGGHVHLDGLDPAIAGGDSRRQSQALLPLPEAPAHEGRCAEHADPEQPADDLAHDCACPRIFEEVVLLFTKDGLPIQGPTLHAGERESPGRSRDRLSSWWWGARIWTGLQRERLRP